MKILWRIFGYFNGQIVPGEHVVAGVREFNVTYAGDDFGKERSIAGVFAFFKHWKQNAFPTLF